MQAPTAVIRVPASPPPSIQNGGVNNDKKITLKVVNPHEEFPDEILFKVYIDSAFSLRNLMKKYCDCVSVAVSDCKFLYNGKTITPEDKLSDLDIYDNATIYVLDEGKEDIGWSYSPWWGEEIYTSSERLVPSIPPSIQSLIEVKVILETDISNWHGFGLVDLDSVVTYALPRMSTLGDLISIVNLWQGAAPATSYHVFWWERFVNSSSRPTKFSTAFFKAIIELGKSELIALLCFREISEKLLQEEEKETVSVFLKLHAAGELVIPPFLLGTYSINDQLARILVEKEFSTFYTKWYEEYGADGLAESDYDIQIYKEVYPFPTMLNKLDMNGTFKENGVNNFDILVLEQTLKHTPPATQWTPRHLSMPEFYWARYANALRLKVKNKDEPHETLCIVEVSRKMSYKSLQTRVKTIFAQVGILLHAVDHLEFYRQNNLGLPEEQPPVLSPIITVAEILHPDKKPVDTIFVTLPPEADRMVVKRISMEGETFLLKKRGLYVPVRGSGVVNPAVELSVCKSILKVLAELAMKEELDALALLLNDASVDTDALTAKKNQATSRFLAERLLEIHPDDGIEKEEKNEISHKLREIIERLSRDALAHMSKAKGDTFMAKAQPGAKKLDQDIVDGFVFDHFRRLLAKQEEPGTASEEKSSEAEDEEAKQMLYYWLKEENSMLANFKSSELGERGKLIALEEEKLLEASDSDALDNVMIEKTKQKVAEEMAQLFLLQDAEFERGHGEFVEWMNEHGFSEEEQKQLTELVDQYLVSKNETNHSFPPAPPSIFLRPPTPSQERRKPEQEPKTSFAAEYSTNTEFLPEDILMLFEKEKEPGKGENKEKGKEKEKEKEDDVEKDSTEEKPEPKNENPVPETNAITPPQVSKAEVDKVEITKTETEKSLNIPPPIEPLPPPSATTIPPPWQKCHAKKILRREIEAEVLALKQLVEAKDLQVSHLMKRVNLSEESMSSHIQEFQKRMEEMEIKVNESRVMVDDVTQKLNIQQEENVKLKKKVETLRKRKEILAEEMQQKNKTISTLKKTQGDTTRELEREKERANKNEARIKELKKQLQKSISEKKNLEKRQAAEANDEREKIFEARYKQEAEERINAINLEWEAKLQKLEAECASVKREKEKIQRTLKNKEESYQRLKKGMEKEKEAEKLNAEHQHKLQVLMGEDQAISECSLAELTEWARILEVSHRKVGEAKIKAEVAQHLADEAKKKKEQERMKKECVVCCDKQKNIVFVPCGHHVCCRSCGDKLTKCPMCRQSIGQRVLVYDS